MRRRLIAPALVLALGLTACSGGEEETDLAQQPEGTTASEPAAPADPPAECPTEAEVVEAPEGVGEDLSARPTVPANSGEVPTQVQVAEVVQGDGETAEPGDLVEVKYVGALDKNGEEFDASWNGGPEQTLPFTVCSQEVVAGFSVAPLGMQVGGRRLVRIPDAFGYPGGNPAAGIAAGDAITFVIDLVSVS